MWVSMGSFRVQADERLVNAALRRVPGQSLQYRHGCILAAVSLPLGSVKAVAIPSFSSSHLVLAVPFKEIKGDITGKFFLSKLISAFWGAVSGQIEKAARPILQKYGLGRDALTIEKVTEAGGEVGKIKVSVDAINRYLAGQHPRLSPVLTEVTFSVEGIELRGELHTVAPV